MRLRKIKNAYEKLLNGDKYFVSDSKSMKGKWHTLFNNNNPIHIEIGCGKGQFMMELAKRNPNINYIQVEFPKKELAETYKKHYESYPWQDKELFIDSDSHISEQKSSKEQKYR